MGLFGKSFDEKVNDALEKVRGQFPGANISAAVRDKTVTLQGQAADVATKGDIMTAFNTLVETDNTINQIQVAQAAAKTDIPLPPPMTSAAPAAPTAAGTPTLRVHEVTKGETLSAIAKHYYGNANQYMKIFEANKDVLNDPDLIKVGQKLKIP